MTAFGDQIREFTLGVTVKSNALFDNVVSALAASITDGSPVTGSPGQPVGQYGPGYHQGDVGGTLKASWHTDFVSPDEASITTNVEWAVQNEYGISATDGPYVQRSSVGGRHSVALTIAGYDRVVENELRSLAGR